MPSSPDYPDRILAQLSALEQTALADFLRLSDGAKGNMAVSEETLMTSLALAYRRMHPSN